MWFKIKSLFAHSRTIFIACLYGAASTLIVAHDFLLPYFTGEDWTPITSRFPAWALPVAGFATNALFAWLRVMTTQSLEANKVQAVVAAADAAAGIPEPPAPSQKLEP